MGKYCISNFSVCLYPAYPPGFPPTTLNTSFTKTLLEPCLFLAHSLELSTTWLVYCVPSASTAKTTEFHLTVQLSFITPRPLASCLFHTCCCRIACVLQHSSEPQISCSNCRQTLSCERLTMPTSLSSLPFSFPLSHLLKANGVLYTTVTEHFQVGKREMEKKRDSKEVNRKIKAEACYMPSSPERFTSESLTWNSSLLISVPYLAVLMLFFCHDTMYKNTKWAFCGLASQITKKWWNHTEWW